MMSTRPDGHVNEDVFAYSNQAGSEKALVVYHNKFATPKVGSAPQPPIR